MRRNKIEVFTAKDGWRWRLRSTNGEIVTQSEGYPTKDHAIRGVSALKRAMIFPKVEITP